MPTPGNPALQGIKYGIESTYGTLVTSSLVALQARGSTLKKVRPQASSGGYMSLQTETKEPMPAYTLGEITAGFSLASATMDGLLGAYTQESTNVFPIGLNYLPDNESLSWYTNFGGVAATDTYETAFVGQVPTKIRIDLPSNASAFMTLGFAGIDESEVGTPADPSPPVQTALLMPSEYGTLSFDSTACTFKGGWVEATIPHTFLGLEDIGADTARRAVWSGNWSANWSFNVQLDDETGSDTIALLSDYISDSAKGNLGTIAIGSWLSLSDAKMIGDHPVHQIGPIDWTVTGNSPLMTITTT